MRMHSTASIDSDMAMPKCGESGSGSGSETPPSDSLQSSVTYNADGCRTQICFDFTKASTHGVARLVFVFWGSSGLVLGGAAAAQGASAGVYFTDA